MFRLVIIFGLVSHVACREVCRDEMSRHQESRQYVLRVYGDFFKTPEEQMKIERRYFSDEGKTKQVPLVRMKPNSYYRGICRRVTLPGLLQPTHLMPTHLMRPKRTVTQSTATQFHGCCASKRIFISPPKAISDHDGTEVELVHFDNEERQYFLVDQCWQDSNCGLMCQCRIQVGLFRALVHNDEYDPDSDDSGEDIPPYLVRTVRLGGSCKCINNYSSNGMWPFG